MANTYYIRGYTQKTDNGISVSHGMITLFANDIMECVVFSKPQGGAWGGPSPISARMLAFFYHVQDGMLSTFLKRKVGCGLGAAQYQLECSLLVFLT